jgi:hypothetical protein
MKKLEQIFQSRALVRTIQAMCGAALAVNIVAAAWQHQWFATEGFGLAACWFLVYMLYESSATMARDGWKVAIKGWSESLEREGRMADQLRKFAEQTKSQETPVTEVEHRIQIRRGRTLGSL